MVVIADLDDDTYEILNGKKFRYERLYAQNPETQQQQSRFDSIIQSVVTSVILGSLYKQLDLETYRIMPRHVLELDDQNIPKVDIGVYKKDSHSFNPNLVYIPEIAFLIDVRVDPLLAFVSKEDYIRTKSQILIDFGVNHVCWIMTDSETLLHFSAQGHEVDITWCEDLVIRDKCMINLDSLLRTDGFKLSK